MVAARISMTVVPFGLTPVRSEHAVSVSSRRPLAANLHLSLGVCEGLATIDLLSGFFFASLVGSYMHSWTGQVFWDALLEKNSSENITPWLGGTFGTGWFASSRAGLGLLLEEKAEQDPAVEQATVMHFCHCISMTGHL